MGQYQAKEGDFVITTHTDEELRSKIIKYDYNWKIENFSTLKQETGSAITSQRIKINCAQLEKNNNSTDEWEIVFYPHGFNQRSADYVSIWLKRISTHERLVRFTCAIQGITSEEGRDTKDKSTEKELVKKSIKAKLSLESAIGWSTFCKRSHILGEKEFLKDGHLTLKCTLEVFEDSNMPHPVLEDEDPNLDATFAELSKDLKELLKDKKNHDVTFKVEKELFTAHKAILSARSPVFRVMFEFESTDQEQEIVITDVKKEAFRAMLLFLYSGESQMIPFETAFELYYAADKYELLSLKRRCSKMLETYLTIENAVKTIVQANRHNDRQLQDACIRFITKNAAEIQKTGEWMNLMKSSPSLANAVFENLTHGT